MDMAGHLGGSRAGSLSLEGAPLMGECDHDTLLNLPEESSLISLARRNTKRNRSLRSRKVMDIQDIIGSRRGSCDSIGDQSLLRPVGFINRHCSPNHGHNSPSLHRSPSPRTRYPQQLHHDIGFSDTVSNVVEIVKHEHQKASQQSRFPRGSWSASTSPTRSPSPTGGRHNPKYAPVISTRKVDHGTTSLCQRSRSPSPTHQSVPHQQGPPLIAGAVVGIPVHQSAVHQGNMQHSHPSLGGRKGQGRRLPPTPCKPSTLQLRPGSINFPKVNASPTHQQLQSQSAHATPQTHPHSFPRDREPLREITPTVTANMSHNININPGNRESTETPLSFEQAVALGRGGRILPSPVPNGFKPRPNGSRNSDSDDDDWC